MSTWGRIGRRLARIATGAARPRRSAARHAPQRAKSGVAVDGRPRYPGDFTGTARIEYSPNPDGEPDPGEVVWAWVPFEEDHGQGKDRPVLVVGRHDRWLLGLMLTSRDHDRDAAQEASRGRRWLDVGTGGWDRQGRPSEVRLDRVLRLDPSGVRREGGQLPRERFDQVATVLRQLHGWP